MVFKRFGRRREVPEADRVASAAAYERATLERCITESLSAELTSAERAAVGALVDASGPSGVLAVVRRHPFLATERGEAALRVLALTAQVLSLGQLLPVVEDRWAWLAQMVEAGVRPDRMQLPDA